MHSSTSRRAAIALASLLILPLAATTAARADGDGANDGGVARISFVQGSVSVQRGDTATPVEAAVNAPVLGADYLNTGPDSRAEVQLDGRSAIRLGSDVQLRFAHLDAGGREVQLAQGTVELRVYGSAEPRTDIDTPSVTVHPVAAGSYRVTVGTDGGTFITARSGRAEVAAPGGPRVLGPGSTLLAGGTASSPTFETLDTVALDDFDTFNRDRDQRLERALAATQPYVNPSVPGIDDLDTYGRWVTDGQYGEVWVPSNVASDWAPYRDGRWVWEDAYGWTWVGYEPWGWAPYHYGRWYRSRYGWAWFPPAASYVQVWRPALVAWFGFGGGGGVSLGFGNIGWVPLAPFEPFYPWWGRGGTTIVNNVTVINNYNGFAHRFRNAGGATAIAHERFLQGRFDHPFAVTAANLHDFHVTRWLPVAPTVAHLRYTEHAGTRVAAATSPAFQRSFAGSGTVAARVPFDQQRSAFAQHRSPFARPAISSQAAPVQPAPADSWSRFRSARGTPEVIDGSARSATTAHARGATVTTSTGGAWSRFDASSENRPRTERATTTPRYAEHARSNDDGTRARAYDASPRAHATSTGSAAAAERRSTRATQSGARERSTSSHGATGSHHGR